MTMPVRSWVVSAVLVALSVSAPGCGDDGAAPEPMDPPNANACSVGTSFSCYRASQGCSGRQLCMPNGLLGPCVCPPDAIDSGTMSDGAMSDGAMPDGAMSDGAMPDGAMPEPDAEPMPGEEDCENGRDDDGDGDIDCADDDCQASQCIPAAPDGFDGPVLTFVGSGDPPTCAGAFGAEGPVGRAGLNAPPADCSSCACSSTSVTCASYLTLVASDQASCAGGCPGSFGATACGAMGFPCLAGDDEGYLRAAVPAEAGACTPSAQNPTIAPATFAQRAASCASTRELRRDGCQRGALCAPPGPFSGDFCVTRAGVHDCPAGDYRQRRVFYGGIADTRACTPCACDRDCDYRLDIYAGDDATCSDDLAATLTIDSPTEAQAQSACTEVPVGAAGAVHGRFSVSGTGSCTASGGAATGQATGTSPITFCCLQ